MPCRLDRCRTCGGGIKFTRGPQWLQPDFFTPHRESLEWKYEGKLPTCSDLGPCPVCVNGGPDASTSASPDDLFGPHLLLWIGRAHYTPESYLKESRELGVSRRLSAIPKGLVIGETWVLLAHLDAVPPANPYTCAECGLTAAVHAGMSEPDDSNKTPCAAYQPPKSTPGIFCAFVPRAVELILKESDATPERREKEAKRGVTIVTVPDDDRDHQGSVWDAKDEEESQPELPGVSP